MRKIFMKRVFAVIVPMLTLSISAEWQLFKGPEKVVAPVQAKPWYQKWFCPSGQLAIKGQCAYLPNLEPIGD